ncbi:MAG TPA: tail fiber protein [Pyrinomonadaceae bacterium]
MGSPYIGEIRMFGGTFAIRGWAFCDGSQLSISQFDALYNLIGTTYGGDGINTFSLPDLRGRVPVGMGQASGLQNYTIGQNGGAETVTLSTGTLPTHNHLAAANNAAGDSNSPAGVSAWAQASGNSRYSTNPPTGAMNFGALSSAGSSQPHENMVPFQCINYIIALEGVFPPRN